MLGAVMVVIVWKLDLQLPMQSVPITTVRCSEFESSSGQGVQHYVTKFVSARDLRQVGGFLQFLPPIKLTAMI